MGIPFGHYYKGPVSVRDEHKSCLDFELEELGTVLRLCIETRRTLLPHITETSLWEWILERKDIIQEALKQREWLSAECKFCYVERLLRLESSHIILLTLRYGGQEEEFKMCILSMSKHFDLYELIDLDNWMSEFVELAIAGAALRDSVMRLDI